MTMMEMNRHSCQEKPWMSPYLQARSRQIVRRRGGRWRRQAVHSAGRAAGHAAPPHPVVEMVITAQ